jgi:hypothetical protein
LEQYISGQLGSVFRHMDCWIYLPPVGFKTNTWISVNLI